MPILQHLQKQQRSSLLARLVELFEEFQQQHEKTADAEPTPHFVEKITREEVLPALQLKDALLDFDNKTIVELENLQQSVPNLLDLNDFHLFIRLQNFLYQIRKQVLIAKNQPVPASVLTEHQERVISPGQQAYEMMGNNYLPIRESRNGYSLIFE